MNFEMFWCVILLCVSCSAQPVDLETSATTKNDESALIDELVQLTKYKWEGTTTVDSKNSISVHKKERIWNYARDASSHLNPCTLSQQEWETAKYLNQDSYDFHPELITVKQCTGVGNNGIYKQQCMRLMDCVTQYQRQRFLRKPKGSSCMNWHKYEEDIPVGCECMMQS
ncbi:uncharacterized protein LOC110234059 isoform X2 [Exaiptasia diaphana]|uniref:Uncharacterized protein n=1 Tax=Exaiptasia diaphana TaxID=2652724 RepID=A0A913WW74_EXADI|nr:uncharacterized protein LOC110234059 isoform X2 [Exaiptasia diaphana]KXJ17382.1 hypothetical protein AC249_AIPGENE23766 [Exaiptasia diaphana]